MADPPPDRLIASGRAADVYDLGDGTVLRRYRDDGHDVDEEARVMRYVAAHGVRVPEVVAAHDRDLVMERIAGRTLLEELAERPTRLLGAGRLVAELQARLADIEAPEWMMPPGWESSGRAATDQRVLHLDLHPMNVMVSDDGPVLIDWTNAAGGPPGFDAAMTCVLVATYEATEWHQQLARRLFLARFRRTRGTRIIAPFMAAACDHRLADRNVTPGERERVAELRRKVV
jgi:aminoglycoside phosphotransferase (APT) family kinase protein